MWEPLSPLELGQELWALKIEGTQAEGFSRFSFLLFQDRMVLLIVGNLVNWSL